MLDCEAERIRGTRRLDCAEEVMASAGSYSLDLSNIMPRNETVFTSTTSLVSQSVKRPESGFLKCQRIIVHRDE